MLGIVMNRTYTCAPTTEMKGYYGDDVLKVETVDIEIIDRKSSPYFTVEVTANFAQKGAWDRKYVTVSYEDAKQIQANIPGFVEEINDLFMHKGNEVIC